MWVAGNEGLARRRPPPRQDPVVALPAAQALEDAGAGSESIKAVECGTAILRAGRNDKGGIGLGAKANLCRPLWAEMAQQPRPPEFRLPRPHLYVPHLEHGDAVPRAPRLGARPEQMKLDRKGGRHREKGIDAGGVRV